jgi:DNA polymerase
MNKASALKKIAEKIAQCRLCKKDKVGLPVPGEGNPDASIMFIGEAPGKKEAATGRPFIGPAGKLLWNLITDSKINEQDVFITSPVKYLPRHVTPTPQEIAHGRVHLNQQINIIQPDVIVLLGRVACLAVLDQHCSMAQDHGKMIKQEGVNYFLSYHPAAPLYSPKLRPIMVRDFKKLKRLISRV